MRKNDPIRMCIACRTRESQKLLIRLQLDGESIAAYRGHGRSFYLCGSCGHDRKRTEGVARRFRVEHEQLLMIIKELETHG